MSDTIAILPPQPETDDLRRVIPGYEAMLLTVLTAILDRCDRDPAYHFIDTKLDIRTGKDFYPVGSAGEAFRGKEVIYSWIQGRGLEALAGHLQWLEGSTGFDAATAGIVAGRIRRQLARTISAMEECRAANRGRVCFCMSPAGTPLEIDNFRYLKPAEELRQECNYSDLFFSKGLFAAARALGWGQKSNEAAEYFKTVLEDIDKRRFRTDQQSFDPKNRVAFVPGKHSQGPMMIALSGIAAVGAVKPDPVWFEYGERFIRRIIGQHINLGQHPHLAKYDFVEAVDDNGVPWEDNGVILCDPGHALEFIGLAARCMSAMRRSGYGDSLIDECARIFPSLLLHCFELGFNTDAGGICKGYDLRARKVINSDMPWWSLPETMRAVTGIMEFTADSDCRKRLMAVAAACSNAFTSFFINPRAHMMAYQTRNERGEVSDVIPATPDADPGYHTGLSIIDFISALSGM